MERYSSGLKETVDNKRFFFYNVIISLVVANMIVSGWMSWYHNLTYRQKLDYKSIFIPEYQSVEIMPINEYRRQNNLYPLRFNQALQDSAYQRAINIQLGLKPFSHDGYQEHINEYYGTDWKILGENLAEGFDYPSDVMTAWIESPTHKDVLLDNTACEYGLARYYSVFVLHIGCK